MALGNFWQEAPGAAAVGVKESPSVEKRSLEIRAATVGKISISFFFCSDIFRNLNISDLGNILHRISK